MLVKCALRRKFSRTVLLKCLMIVGLLLALPTLMYMTRNLFRSNYLSFQQFSYPSMSNFYKILELNTTNNIPKLFQYQPDIIMSPKPDNRTDINIMIIVKSSIGNIDKRNAIRNSWASEFCRFAFRFRVYFALGQNQVDSKMDQMIQSKIDREAQAKNDILQFNFIDKYDNNTFKVLAIMDYFVQHQSNVTYLVIADDDYFIDPLVLEETIVNNIPSDEYPRFLGGYVWYQTKPVRDVFSKWFMSYENYPFEYYPPYPSGGFLLISNPMVKMCHKLLPFLKYSSIDDVMIGILMFKLRIYPTHLNNIYVERPTPFPKNVLGCHKFSDDLQSFWENNQYELKCIRRYAQ